MEHISKLCNINHTMVFCRLHLRLLLFLFPRIFSFDLRREDKQSRDMKTISWNYRIFCSLEGHTWQIFHFPGPRIWRNKIAKLLYKFFYLLNSTLTRNFLDGLVYSFNFLCKLRDESLCPNRQQGAFDPIIATFTSIVSLISCFRI